MSIDFTHLNLGLILEWKYINTTFRKYIVQITLLPVLTPCMGESVQLKWLRMSLKAIPKIESQQRAAPTRNSEYWIPKYQTVSATVTVSEGQKAGEFNGTGCARGDITVVFRLIQCRHHWLQTLILGLLIGWLTLSSVSLLNNVVRCCSPLYCYLTISKSSRYKGEKKVCFYIIYYF